MRAGLLEAQILDRSKMGVGVNKRIGHSSSFSKLSQNAPQSVYRFLVNSHAVHNDIGYEYEKGPWASVARQLQKNYSAAPFLN